MNYNPYEEWDRQHVDDLQDIVTLFEKDKPTVSGWDTETTGLHLIKDKPFLIIFGWLVPKQQAGRVFTFYPTSKNMEIFLKLAEKTKCFVGHNMTFDLSMIKNIGWEYNGDNMVENMVVARLALEALSTREGGDNLQLKHLGTKYVHPHAAYSESKVKDELQKLERERVQVLTAALAQFDHPTETETKPYRLDTGKKTTSTYAKKNPDNVEWRTTPKKWNKGLVQEFLKDITHDPEDLPEGVREVWLDWQEEYPEPTYADVPRETMIRYAGDDVITMLEFFRKAIRVVTQREQGEILKKECRLIPAILDMERHGLRTDREYLENCRRRMKEYIKEKRQEMYTLIDRVVNVGQDQTIIKVFREKWGITLTNCNKATLKRIINEEINQPVPEDAKKYAKLITQLRRLEKWYSTYVVRILERSKYDGRLYLQLNQAGAVSGRFTSDGQQFPKDAIYDENGEELFNPRRAFIADEGTKWYFLDYSQIELRSQANYTILVSGGDLNMCRAYMPFKCHGEVNGKKGEYNYKDPKKRKYWKLEKFWKDENGEYWTPTDVHGQTAHNALVLLGYKCHDMYKSYTYEGEGEGFFGNELDEAGFKKVRNKGKTFNFMKNYGGGLGAAMEQLNLPKFVAEALIQGYEKAFPGVIAYGEAVQYQHQRRGYVQNMYGRRYYLNDLNKSYVLNNYLIQGTCADLLKDSMLKIYEYLKSQNCKTKMIMCIHDEIQFTSVKGEEHHIMECKKIMEKHDWHYVPIVADVEVTETSWADKEEVSV